MTKDGNHITPLILTPHSLLIFLTRQFVVFKSFFVCLKHFFRVLLGAHAFSKWTQEKEFCSSSNPPTNLRDQSICRTYYWNKTVCESRQRMFDIMTSTKNFCLGATGCISMNEFGERVPDGHPLVVFMKFDGMNTRTIGESTSRDFSPKIHFPFSLQHSDLFENSDRCGHDIVWFGGNRCVPDGALIAQSCKEIPSVTQILHFCCM